MLALLRRRHATILTLLVATSLLWRAFAFKGIATGWDESVYVGMGRYLVTGGREGIFEPIRPPGWPLLLGAFDCAHLDAAVAGRYLSGALLVGCLLLTRGLLRSHVKEELITVVCAAVFLAPHLVGVALLTHVPATFFALLALRLYGRERFFWAGLCAGAAFSVRFTFLLFVAAAVVVTARAAWRSRRAGDLGALCLGVSLPVLGVLTFDVVTNIHEVGFWEATVRPLVLGSQEQSNTAWARAGLFANVFFYVRALASRTGILLLGLVALWPTLFARTPPALRIAVVSLGAMMAYYTWAPNKQERFALDFVFFAGLGAALTVEQLATRYRVSERVRERLVFGALGVSASFLLGSLAVLEVPPAPGAEAYFAHENGKKILTVTPTFAPYGEQNLFVPLYMRHELPLVAYRRAALDADYAIYEPSFFFCGDDACRDQVRRVGTELEKGALVASLPLRDKTARVYRLR